MMRFIKKALLGLLIFFIFLSIAFGWLYNSQSGLQLLLGIARPYLPTELNIENVTGSLSTSIEFQNFRFSNSSIDIKAEQGVISCHWLEFIFQHYRCRVVNIPNLQVTTVSSELEEDPVSFETLPQLSDFTLDLIARLDNLAIKKLTLNQVSVGKAQTQTVIENISVQQLKWQNNKAQLGNLSLETQGNQLSLKGQLSPQNNWPGKLEMNFASEQHQANLVLNGSLLYETAISGHYDGLIKTELNATLLFRNGKPLVNAELNAEQQTLDHLVQELSVQKVQLPITLDWPKLTSELSGKIRYQDEIIELKQDLSIESILNWGQSTTGAFLVKGAIKRNTLLEQMTQANSAKINTNKTNNANTKDSQSHRSISSHSSNANPKASLITSETTEDTASTKKNNELIPITIDIPLTVKNGQLVSKSKSITVDNIELETNLIATIVDNAIRSLKLNSKLSATKLPAWLPIEGNGVAASFEINRSDKSSKWDIKSIGKINTLNYQQYSIDTLTWQALYQDKIESDIAVNRVNLALNGQNFIFKRANIDLTGTPTNHRLTVNTQLNQTDLKLLIDGQLIDNQKHQAWKSSKIKLDIDGKDKQLSLETNTLELNNNEMKFANLCIQGIGEVCSTGDFSSKSWSIKSDVNTLTLSDLPFWLNAMNIKVPFEVYGLLSGSFNISGRASNIDNFQVQLKSPVLSLKKDDYSAVFSQLELNSEKHEKAHTLNTSWQNFSGEFKLAPQVLNTFTGSGAFTANFNSIDYIDATLEQPDILLQMITSTGTGMTSQNLEFPINQLKASLILKDKTLNASTETFLFNDDKIILNWQSGFPITTETKVNGNIEVALSNFSWLQKWQTRIDSVDLNWNHKAEFSGPLSRLNVQGGGKLKVNELVMEELGLQIENSYLDIKSDNELLKLVGELNNQKGKLNFDGEVKLWPTIEAKADITGNKITVIDTDKQKLVVSPTVSAIYEDQLLDINGRILLNEARVEVNKIPQSKVSVSDDQMFVGQATVQEETFRYRVKLDVVMGNSISFSGFGLSSSIGGQLKLLAQSGQALKVDGQLKLINGKFEAYKQSLTIEEGQLLFLGSPENPGIQFKATRTIEDIVVGVIADGTLLNPKLTLYSDPIMPEENVLALLLTGRSIESLSESEGNALANAAISLGVEGANKIAQQIGAALGIKNVQVTSKNTADTSRINIETQLNDRLSVGYGTTIDSQNETQVGWVIEYKLSPKLSFEAVSGEEVSASITYKNQFNSTTRSNDTQEQEDEKKSQ